MEEVNGINGHGNDVETFLFTSESVGEGHPGMLLSFYLIKTKN